MPGGSEKGMIETLRKFFDELTGGAKHPGGFDENDYRLASAALLLHAAAIDGKIAEVERNLLRELLQQRFDLDDAATSALIATATAAEHEAIDLYHFTHLLNRLLDDDGRCRIIEMMWQIVFADGRITEFEDNLIWRTADLLGVSSHERIALRRRIARKSKSGA
jgi:uncharacterized tellurite resistance protein B-like protein